MFLKVYPNYFCINQKLAPITELCPTMGKDFRKDSCSSTLTTVTLFSFLAANNLGCLSIRHMQKDWRTGKETQEQAEAFQQRQRIVFLRQIKTQQFTKVYYVLIVESCIFT